MVKKKKEQFGESMREGFSKLKCKERFFLTLYKILKPLAVTKSIPKTMALPVILQLPF